MRWNPKPYQRKAMKFVLQHSNAGLFLDPGLGKTSVVLATYKVLRGERQVRRALVIAPLRPARSVWCGERGEAQKWEDFHDVKVQLLHGKEKWERVHGKADVDVINPEGLPWLWGEVAKMKKWPWDMLIVDESSKFKRTTTLRFKQLRPYLSRFRRRVIMTGTPAPNGLLDLFGQIYILDLGNALGQFITHYRMKYFYPTGFGGYTWLPQKSAEQRIYEQLRHLTLRMDAADHLKLPKLLPPNDILIDLPDDAQRHYDQMEKTLLTAIEDELVSAPNVAAATIKCRQIANGGIYTGAQHQWKNIHDAKTEVVQELVEELEGKPALVAYEFKHDLDRLKKAFKDAPHLGGGVTGKQQLEIEAAWNAGALPVLLAQPQSVAHGLNLQEVGSAVVWHSLTYNLEDYIQFIRRVWRQGQKARIGVHRIIARRTVDEAIVLALARKNATQRDLLDALRKYAMTKKTR